ncbi:MAG: thiamine-phosphate kinase [Bacteroidales bacterium]|jgi:thiamine-monophosphate kinase|nr:thiamine-phosphate kinase [Bacteroidales bacterium]
MVNKTNISTLGEFGLIKHLTQDIKPKNNTTKYGIGDDAAVLDFKGYQTLVTSDILLEGIHFNLEYVPLKHLGYKAAVVNFSDIYAMNGRPTQLIVSLGISKRFAVEDLEQLYAGLKAACDIYGVDIVGGDTTSSMTGLTICITCIGEAKKEDIVYRNGAKINDLICCTGNLGAAYMGLQLLERERAVGETDPEKAQKAFEGREYILERQLKPEARKDVIAALKKADIHPTSMMDISDGLSSELLHICSQSKVGCSVYADKLPIDYQSAAMAEEMNLDIVTCALNGGEDYELLFTIDQKDYEKIIPVEDVNIIGYIQKPELGCNLVGRNGEEIALKAQGFNAFNE